MRFKLLIFVFTFLCGLLHAQQTPKTLLWRISGNNFAKPSYLFGTMHSGDKRVYYLGDSVYSSLQYCDGFVMEIDPGEYIDTIINSMESKLVDVSYKDAVEGDLVKKKPDYKALYAGLDSMLTKLRERYRDMSPMDWARLERAYRRRDKNNMKTQLDLYLFDLAKKQGKLVGGIEDIAGRDQIKDELGNSFDPDEFLKNQRKKYVDVEEWMVVNYTAAELDKLHEFGKQAQTGRQLSILLYNRNNIMAERIDSLGKIRSTFCAVGAAHLPGDSGVIDLLRRKGFTVTPVFSSKKIEPGKIKIDNSMQELINVSDIDSNYIVQMPGKPTELFWITDKLFVKAYKELSNEILLMCGENEDGNINTTIEKEVDEIKSFFTRNDVKIYNTTKIKRQGLDGYEMNFKSPVGYINMHIFYKHGKTYLFASGSKNKDSLNSGRCKDYLDSYRMILNKPVSNTKLISFTDPEKAFSISFPASPKVENIKGDKTYTKEDVTFFTSTDMKNKISYLVLLKEPFKGYYIDYDSAVFIQTINQVKKGITETAVSQENVILDDYPALKVKLIGESDGKTHVVYIVLTIRQNRLYTLTARSLALPGYEPEFEKFFNSFHFLPYLKTPFKKQTGGNNLFSVVSPSTINILQNETDLNNKRIDYFAYDSSTAMSYGITALGFNKYYWTDGETSLLNEYARFNFNDSLAVNNIFNNDSLIYKKPTYNGKIEGRELLLKSQLNNSYTRLRIMHYGDLVFIINIKADEELVTDENADIFFNSFRFINENFTSSAYLSKTSLLIQELQSDDISKRTEAAETLQKGFKFPRQDILILLNALLFNYQPVNAKDINIPWLLAKAIEPYAGEKVYEFIKTNYPLLREKREDIRILMVNILSASKDREAYQVLKNILLNDPPANADYGIAMFNFKKAPVFSATLFPDVAVKLKESTLTPIIIDLANMLIDSNKMEYNSISAFDEDILKFAKELLRDYRKNNAENFYPPHTEAVLEILAKMNQKQASSLLKDFLDLRNYNLTEKIIVAMAKVNQQTSAELIDRFCANINRRIALYDKLYAIGKQSYFKGEYANQRSFAEAFTMLYTNNEISENIQKDYELVTTKEVKINQVTSIYYIYKITCRLKRGVESYTSIMGPFSADANDYSIQEGKELYILYRTKFDLNAIDNLFTDFVDKISNIK